MSLSLLFSLLLLVVQLVHNELMLLLEDGLFLGPTLLGQLEGILGILQLRLQVLNPLVVEHLLALLSLLDSVGVLLVPRVEGLILPFKLSLGLPGLLHVLLHVGQLVRVQVLLVLHLEVQLGVLVFVLVDLLLKLIDLLDLLLELLLQSLVLFLVLVQEVTLAVFQLSRYLLLSAVAFLKALLEELDLLVEECFLLLKLRLRANLLPLDFLLGFLGLEHLVIEVVDLRLKLLLLAAHLLVQLSLEQALLALHLLQLLFQSLLLGTELGLLNFDTAEFGFNGVQSLLLFILDVSKLLLQLTDMLLGHLELDVHLVDLVSHEELGGFRYCLQAELQHQLLSTGARRALLLEDLLELLDILDVAVEVGVLVVLQGAFDLGVVLSEVDDALLPARLLVV
mmetsp:Transcript_9207/g.13956  ORF Transcript_9207/g.13956 Transcript_9207/m.13956 type:complete len:395 (-) Transcript_9207:1253-2437(-)